MDVTLQRHYAKFIYVIPSGLRELMSDIIREVLRTQPKDLYTFIADYLDALVITRENARVASRLVMDILQISQTTAELLTKTGISKATANRAASIIQRKFREYIETKFPDKKQQQNSEQIVAEIIEEAGISVEDAENAVMIIQKAFRGFVERKEREKQLLGDMVDWRVAAKCAIALYRKTGVTSQEAHRAATLIKSAYKGFYQRKVMSQLVDDMKATESEECLCEQYSVDMPPPPARMTESQECICSDESDDEIAETLQDECICSYTSSEIIEIGKGEREIIRVPLTPPEEVEEDDGYCYCSENPSSASIISPKISPAVEKEDDEVVVTYERTSTQEEEKKLDDED